MRSSLGRRLELLESRVLPSSEEPRTLLIQFVSETGEVVSTVPVMLDPSRVTTGQSWGRGRRNRCP